MEGGVANPLAILWHTMSRWTGRTSVLNPLSPPAPSSHQCGALLADPAG